VWHMWWAVIAGLVVAWGAVIARSFARNTERIIPAENIAAQQGAWLQMARDARAVPRELEFTPENKGLAEVVT